MRRHCQTTWPVLTTAPDAATVSARTAGTAKSGLLRTSSAACQSDLSARQIHSGPQPAPDKIGLMTRMIERWESGRVDRSGEHFELSVSADGRNDVGKSHPIAAVGPPHEGVVRV